MKVAGVAAGTFIAGGALKLGNKLTNSAGQPLLNNIMQGIGLVLIGAIGPGVLGLKKTPMIDAAGVSVISKGTDALLREYVPSMVSGVDDAITGADQDGDYVYGAEESINDMDDPGIVQGTEEYQSVSGANGGVGNTI